MAPQRTLLSHDPLTSVKLLEVPDVAPPFDGEVRPARTAESAVPTCDDDVPSRVTERASSAPLSAQAGCRHAAGGGHAADCGDWTRQFAALLVETLSGARPLRQLMPWMSGRAQVHLRRVAPVLRCGQRPRVLRVLASQPQDDVVEMSVIVGLGSRTRALAVRLEAARASQPARWLCTDIEAA